MKIASFNINNINRRLANLLHWLREAEPDIVCLQELKATGTEFQADVIRAAGYHAVWRGERRWNGVAILARWAPVMTRVDLPGDASDGGRQDPRKAACPAHLEAPPIKRVVAGVSLSFQSA
jgi:exodeoxyribonuclease III